MSVSSPDGERVEPHEYPLPVEIPVTENVGSPDLGLKTQIIRFLVTGGLSAVVDFGLYILLLSNGMDVRLAKSIGFIAGTTTAYLINRRWTFQAPPSRTRFAAVVALYAVTFGVQVGINTVLYEVLPDTDLNVLVAFVIAQGAATVINFVVQRRIIFKLD
ncbi:GtrA family protein [Tomitella biformata]|uniref:GtrA family protein n=1 Tax=Tomitella biformata TaxID=630403 RepID=UPI00272AA320|nr:GtrA family protein [Tomitella biformata]